MDTPVFTLRKHGKMFVPVDPNGNVNGPAVSSPNEIPDFASWGAPAASAAPAVTPAAPAVPAAPVEAPAAPTAPAATVEAPTVAVDSDVQAG